MEKFKVILNWAGCESEETYHDTEEEAKQYIRDIVAPGSNSHATIEKCEVK